MLIVTKLLMVMSVVLNLLPFFQQIEAASPLTPACQCTSEEAKLSSLEDMRKAMIRFQMMLQETGRA